MIKCECWIGAQLHASTELVAAAEQIIEVALVETKRRFGRTAGQGSPPKPGLETERRILRSGRLGRRRRCGIGTGIVLRVGHPHLHGPHREHRSFDKGSRWAPRSQGQACCGRMTRRTKKNPRSRSCGGSGKDPGDDLLSHAECTLPSARARFTSEFGMGSGGSTQLLSPGRGWRVAGFLRSSAHALIGSRDVTRLCRTSTCRSR